MKFEQKMKEELIEVLIVYRHLYSFVSEVCIDVSKLHILSDKGIEDIRKYLCEHQNDYR